MTDGAMKADSLSIQKLTAEIATHPGLTVDQLSARLGMSVSYLRKCFRFSVHHNLLGCVPLEFDQTGRLRGWYTAKDLPIVQQRWDKIAGERAEKRGKARLAKLREKEDKSPTDAGLRVVHRIVKAGSKKPLPFQVKAARSVFDLGAA